MDTMRTEYRTLTEPEQLAMKEVKLAGEAFLATLDKFCHPGRETSLARTNAEQSVMWAVKGITG